VEEDFAAIRQQDEILELRNFQWLRRNQQNRSGGRRHCLIALPVKDAL
jgi:hypothetical protein